MEQESIKLPVQYPTSQQLTPLATVIRNDDIDIVNNNNNDNFILNKNNTIIPNATITTRSDHVNIIQHMTGERLVHHSDGTRIFHSFALYDQEDEEEDDEQQRQNKSKKKQSPIQRYEQETGNKPPVKAVICIENPNTPRVLIYLSQQNQYQWERDRVVVVMPDGASLEWHSQSHKIILSKPDSTHLHYNNDGSVSIYIENAAKRAPPSTYSYSNGRLPLLYYNTQQGTLAVRPSNKLIQSMQIKDVINKLNNEKLAKRPTSSQKIKNKSPRSSSSSISRSSNQSYTQIQSQQQEQGSQILQNTSKLLDGKQQQQSNIQLIQQQQQQTKEIIQQSSQLSTIRLFLTTLEGVGAWITTKTMKSASFTTRIPGLFLPSFFGEGGEFWGGGKRTVEMKDSDINSNVDSNDNDNNGNDIELDIYNNNQEIQNKDQNQTNQQQGQNNDNQDGRRFYVKIEEENSSTSQSSSSYSPLSYNQYETSSKGCLSSQSLVESILQVSGSEDHDSSEYMEKKYKETKKQRDRSDLDVTNLKKKGKIGDKIGQKGQQQQQQDQLNAQRRGILSPSQNQQLNQQDKDKQKLDSTNNSVNLKAFAQTIRNPVIDSSSPENSNQTEIQIPDQILDDDKNITQIKNQFNYEQNDTEWENPLSFTTQRWVSRLAALHAHQTQK
ncbi:MAG: hypothetical protein EZS28_033601, partial [Streblomastix strix]